MLNIKPGQVAKVKKAELKYTASGSSICTFFLYTSSKKRGAAGDKKEDYDTHWFNGVSFKDTAQIMSGLKDGTKIVLNSAAIQQERWIGQDGKERTGYKVLVFDAAIGDATSQVRQAVQGEDVDDMPF